MLTYSRMGSYLRFTRSSGKPLVMRRLFVLAVWAALGCASRPEARLAPQSMNDTVAQFFAAVRANDATRIGTLWGTERGPAAEWMKPDELKKRAVVIQK